MANPGAADATTPGHAALREEKAACIAATRRRAGTLPTWCGRWHVIGHIMPLDQGGPRVVHEGKVFPLRIDGASVPPDGGDVPYRFARDGLRKAIDASSGDSPMLIPP